MKDLIVKEIINTFLQKKIATGLEKTEKTDEIYRKYSTSNWFDEVASNAHDVYLSLTHVIKLTHSSISDASSITVEYNPAINGSLITARLRDQKRDYSYSGATLAPIAEFLSLDCEGEPLGRLFCRDPSLFRSFAKNDEQLKKWKEKIQSAFIQDEKSSHTLAKQIFYPVEQGYHLLSPLVSSTMAQLIYERIWQTRQKNMKARKLRNEKFYFEENDVLFFETATLKVTQSNHQNVSSLNGKRRGGIILLSCKAPQWQTQTKPPDKIKSIFDKNLGYRAAEPLRELKNLLLAIKKNSLSKNLQRNEIIKDLLSDIAEIVFDSVAKIQNMKNQTGWSQESKLPLHQQFWLDPHRQDEAFQTERETDWELEILSDFSRWINKQIRDEKLTLGVPQEKHWEKYLTPLLREFNAMTDVSIQIAVRQETK
jgi:CRISPR-associated protein Csy1